MRSLVTGGAGFIGSHLVDRLLAEGHEVVVLDDLSTGHRGNLEHLKRQDELEFHEVDVRDHDEICKHFEAVEWVFHLAALADIVPSIQKPLEYLRAGVDGTISVLEAARHAGVKKFLYAASSSCYGIPDAYPTPEDAEVRPQYPYALAKNLGEQCVMHWVQVYGLPAISLRLFNVYGPRARTTGTYGAVFGVFLAQKLAGKPFTVVGDGTQTRDFTYVIDVVEAFTSAAKSDVIGEIMNVGSSQTYSINRLVELLGGEVVHIPKRPGEPSCTFADVSKIRKLLNWKAVTRFDEGVAIMLKNIDYWRDAPVWESSNVREQTKDWFKYLA
ncbi:MAG: NAD-dependent dehydratase [Proteobacteria bacterium TMED61]|nr:MAG: NAD-dependent dehydratase [Proteobacteria bacterium TMED61]